MAFAKDVSNVGNDVVSMSLRFQYPNMTRCESSSPYSFLACLHLQQSELAVL